MKSTIQTMNAIFQSQNKEGKMKTRKIILLAACAVLLCVCVVQGITGLKNPVKTFT